MEATYAPTAQAVLPARRLARSCGYLVAGGALIGYLISGFVPTVTPVQAAGVTVRCGQMTLKGAGCKRVVRRGGRCPFHGVPLTAR